MTNTTDELRGIDDIIKRIICIAACVVIQQSKRLNEDVGQCS